MNTIRLDVKGKGYVTAEVIGNAGSQSFESEKIVFSAYKNGEAEATESAEMEGREGMNKWYEENVGYRPDDEGGLDISELTESVAEMFFFHVFGVD